MSSGLKWGIILVTLVGAGAGLKYWADQTKKNKPTEVKLEQVSRRDLVSVVTASGKIEAKTKVDISADVTGRILKIAVKEGDLVQQGQFLLQIDPVQFQGAVARGEAGLANAEASLIQARTNRDQAQRSFQRATELQASGGTLSTGNALISKEAVEQAQQAYDVAKAVYASNEALVEQAKAGLKESRDNLARTRLFAPISGRVVRLAVKEGEVAVPGTFSKDVGLIMTIADMSVILAKVQIDETDVVKLHPGDSVSVAIDAFPDTTFIGKVTKIGNSAKLTTGATSGQNDRAVDFDVEVTLTAPPRDTRPDLSCTARIVTDTRRSVPSIRIIALTVRQHDPVPGEPARGAPVASGPDSSKAPKPKEIEGVFVVRDGIATFRPVKVGIAGDDYFEVINGVKEGETIVAGTYQAIRDLKDGAKVKEATLPDSLKKAGTPS
jgi:HlyD family secretion protein